MLGYKNNNSSYRIPCLSDKRILISRHVKFDETVFTSLKDSPQSQEQLTIAWESNPSRTEVVDEIHPVRAELVDEPQPEEPAVITREDQEMVVESHSSSDDSLGGENSHPVVNPCIKVIGSRHPTIYSANINKSNILPFSRRPRGLVTSVGDCPRTYKKALVSADKDHWVSAIEKELASINTLKARLCPQGFTQTPGLDFNKTYAPTGRLNSLWTVIAFAVSNNLEFHQVDVKSAVLNAPLVETVYLSIPQGLVLDQRKLCLRRNKAIYGLKQAPLAWYEWLQKWLLGVGFIPCILDPCVFYCLGQVATWLYVHVDDIAIFSSSASSFKEELAREFYIKDIGPADLMLGVKVSRSATGEEISKFNLLGVSYHSAIGSINYLRTATRPDLAHSVSSLLQFLENPGIQHWNGFLHVLRYLKGTQSIGLVYSKTNAQGIEAYSDADWGNCQLTRRSVTGYLATFVGSLVLWKTRKQSTMSLSTAEAKYKA
ncbi:hypothetical protein O181_059496 [Austropuccinia psidii MF-1]|uniref:Reverse transcriptase Ty1/copia-type domain-containing protein n=1 Tax=Austropuccinia psidii MF-1 TaxID=1389203 RepID=A0A9Q3ECB4_9BASI|nr:hypothetical protein [Austropuccinia psidii MF-1]